MKKSTKLGMHKKIIKTVIIIIMKSYTIYMLF